MIDMTETKMTKAQEKELRERRRDYRDATSLMVSIASLGIGVAALCMNEKPEGRNDFETGDKMSDCKYCNTRSCNGTSCTRSCNTRSCNARGPVRSRNEASTDELLAKAKREKKEAAKAKRAAKAGAKAAKDRQKAERSAQQEKIRAYAREIGYTGPIITPNAKSDFDDMDYRYSGASRNTRASDKAWVAMEMNKRTGGDRQAIVCSSRDEAEARARKMKSSHSKGSQRAKDCIQGYARLDVTQPIDIPGCFNGGCGLTRV